MADLFLSISVFVKFVHVYVNALCVMHILTCIFVERLNIFNLAWHTCSVMEGFFSNYPLSLY